MQIERLPSILTIRFWSKQEVGGSNPPWPVHKIEIFKYRLSQSQILTNILQKGDFNEVFEEQERNYNTPCNNVYYCICSWLGSGLLAD